MLKIAYTHAFHRTRKSGAPVKAALAVKNEATVVFDTKQVAARIKEVAIRENKLSERVAHDVAFHMTDWLENLASYSEFCANPNKMKNKEVEKLLLAFLIHVPNHIAAASKLYTEIPVTDIFGVGATTEGSDP